MKRDQDIFDIVAAHLLKQGVKSGEIKGEAQIFHCQYRDKNGNRCAAGALIEVGYDEDLEGGTVNGERQRLVLQKNGLTPQQIGGLLTSLQEVHDNSEPEHWAEQLDWVAEQYGLKAYRP